MGAFEYVAMDQAGNFALAFNVTSTSTYPSLRYTGRLADDPAGVMTQTETQQVTGSGTGSGRWGDYASINIDPEDDCTYWFTSEYQNGSGWATQITSFRFDASDLMPGEVGAGSFWKGMTDWVSGAADLDTVLAEIDASWPQ